LGNSIKLLRDPSKTKQQVALDINVFGLGNADLKLLINIIQMGGMHKIGMKIPAIVERTKILEKINVH
jgi:hypothetical protein